MFLWYDKGRHGLEAVLDKPNRAVRRERHTLHTVVSRTEHAVRVYVCQVLKRVKEPRRCKTLVVGSADVGSTLNRQTPHVTPVTASVRRHVGGTQRDGPDPALSNLNPESAVNRHVHNDRITATI